MIATISADSAPTTRREADAEGATALPWAWIFAIQLAAMHGGTVRDNMLRHADTVLRCLPPEGSA